MEEDIGGYPVPEDVAEALRNMKGPVVFRFPIVTANWGENAPTLEEVCRLRGVEYRPEEDPANAD